MGLLNKERTPEEAFEDDFCLVLTAQSSHQSVSSVEEVLVVVQYTRFPRIIGGTNAPYGMERVLHHQGFPLL